MKSATNNRKCIIVYYAYVGFEQNSDDIIGKRLNIIEDQIDFIFSNIAQPFWAFSSI